MPPRLPLAARRRRPARLPRTGSGQGASFSWLVGSMVGIASVVTGPVALLGLYVPLPFLSVPRLLVFPAVSAAGLALGIRALRRSRSGRGIAVAGVVVNSLFFVAVVIALAE